MSYCTECGKKNLEVLINKYDKDTGKQITKSCCPTGLCEHEGIWHHFVHKPGFLKRLLNEEKCDNCGLETWGYD